MLLPHPPPPALAWHQAHWLAVSESGQLALAAGPSWQLVNISHPAFLPPEEGQGVLSHTGTERGLCGVRTRPWKGQGGQRGTQWPACLPQTHPQGQPDASSPGVQGSYQGGDGL